MVYLFKLQRVSTPGATTEETYFFSACLIAFLVNASFDVAKYPSGTYFMLLKTENNYALSTVVIK